METVFLIINMRIESQSRQIDNFLNSLGRRNNNGIGRAYVLFKEIICSLITNKCCLSTLSLEVFKCPQFNALWGFGCQNW